MKITISKTRQTPEAIGNNVKGKAKRISRLPPRKSPMMLPWRLKLREDVKLRKLCWQVEQAVVMTQMMILSLARKRSRREGRKRPPHSKRTIDVINARARRAARISNKPKKRKKNRLMKRARRRQPQKSLKKFLTMGTMMLKRRRKRQMKERNKSKAQR